MQRSIISVDLAGSGLWNELGQEITFTVGASTGGAGVVLVFIGLQVQGPSSADPAQDVSWTLAGSFHHPLALPSLGAGVTQAIPMPPLPHESTRRTRFGWYAQIRQVL